MEYNKKETVIGIAKGELGKDIEEYLKGYGVDINVTGRPKLTQQYGNKIFRIVRSRDMPRFVGVKYDFGITGKDCCEDELLGGNKNFKYLKDLDFGKGTLLFYTNGKNKIRKPKIVTSKYYENLASKYAKELFDDFSLFSVFGATEGYVSAYLLTDEADMGFDCTFSGDTLSKEGLDVLKETMNTNAVVIGSKEYTEEDFDDLVLDDFRGRMAKISPYDEDCLELNGRFEIKNSTSL